MIGPQDYDSGFDTLNVQMQKMIFDCRAALDISVQACRYREARQKPAGLLCEILQACSFDYNHTREADGRNELGTSAANQAESNKVNDKRVRISPSSDVYQDEFMGNLTEEQLRIEEPDLALDNAFRAVDFVALIGIRAIELIELTIQLISVSAQIIAQVYRWALSESIHLVKSTFF